MAAKKEETLYVSGQFALIEGDSFGYELRVYEVDQRKCILVEAKDTTLKTFKGFGSTKEEVKNQKRYLVVTELISAPKSFLDKEDFKPYVSEKKNGQKKKNH